MSPDPQGPSPATTRPLDTDALMRDIAAQLEHSDHSELAPFVDEFSGRIRPDDFVVTAEVHPSDKPVVGPLVTRGKLMAARAALPMLADLSAQVATAIAALQASIDDLNESNEDLRRRLDEMEKLLRTRESP
jgi:hypothetical protein